MKRTALLFILTTLLLTLTTGCWSVRYNTANDGDYYYYPSSPNIDYINSLAPETEEPVAPKGK